VGNEPPLFGADLGELRHVRPKEMLVRFAFGAAISVIAGLAATVLGSVAGGLLLAFPAILPAALTLIEDEQGTDAAVHDVGGAMFGGVGLVAFAAVGAVMLGVIPAPGALALALAAWTVVSVVLYVLRAVGVLRLPASIAGRGPAGGDGESAAPSS
jgi:uncharacterized membrane protein (GlpM family)